ncbi:unnamed protein product [Urochloa humidicola]
MLSNRLDLATNSRVRSLGDGSTSGASPSPTSLPPPLLEDCQAPAGRGVAGERDLRDCRELILLELDLACKFEEPALDGRRNREEEQGRRGRLLRRCAEEQGCRGRLLWRHVEEQGRWG